ncbi:hypothetical protein STHAL_32355 [Streptomyces halstedii]|uniref:Uncharacterized protein n=1 Tax=Streptomyces halstedii TaxID=1944 RepID=A0ABS6U145_STRHA|nr:hypothetical protein [Streptomyces halstedii]MBV7674141.1 hypothetical protein [Streptomyces halstedii]
MSTGGVVAVAALALGYLVGRVRPWRRLGNWAEDQLRFTGSWVRGGTAKQAFLAVVHGLTRPRTTMRILCISPRAMTLAPARDPHWAANRSTSSTGVSDGPR